MTRSETHKNNKVVIEDDQVQYPNGAVTMDEDCDRGNSFVVGMDG